MGQSAKPITFESTDVVQTVARKIRAGRPVQARTTEGYRLEVNALDRLRRAIREDRLLSFEEKKTIMSKIDDVIDLIQLIING
jgi:hypothetical protein